MVGVASAISPPEVPALLDWLSAGYHASMRYMEARAAVRSHIKNWYPDAKSVVVCGFNYASNQDAPVPAGRGRIARYARLPDYHDELRDRLDGVLGWLRAHHPGADGKVFVDSSPVLERAYARMAGLGWIGKNTMLINPKNGSYFFLAGIALNIELPGDPVSSDHCGECTRCLDACPTEAFPLPGVLDAGKCVSFLTIENRGPIPEPLRAGVGDWVFGCDVCQEVCPWNRFAKPGAAFPASGPASLDLAETAALDDASFKARHGATPLSRAKRKGLARNALLAMGNAGDPAHRDALERGARDPDPVVAEQAAWGLARLPASERT